MNLLHNIDEDLNKLLSKLYEYIICSSRYTSGQFTVSYEANVKKKMNLYFFGKGYNTKQLVFDMFNDCRIGGKIIPQKIIPSIVYDINKTSITGYLSFLVRCGYITKCDNKTGEYKLNCRIPANLKLTDIKDKDNLKKIQRSVKIKTLGIK
jgi:hypothetical protein